MLQPVENLVVKAGQLELQLFDLIRVGLATRRRVALGTLSNAMQASMLKPVTMTR